MRNEQYRPAGLWVRSLAFALDYLPIAAYLAVLVAAGVVASRSWPSVTRGLFGNPLAGEASGFLLITVPVILYFALAEASVRMATWGKRRMRLRVANLAGERIGLARSFVRTTLKFVPWELAHAFVWRISFASDKSSSLYTMGFALVWLLVATNVIVLVASPRRQTLYDRLAGTVVLHARGSAT